jgi:hypothetical protein
MVNKQGAGAALAAAVVLEVDLDLVLARSELLVRGDLVLVLRMVPRVMRRSREAVSHATAGTPVERRQIEQWQ